MNPVGSVNWSAQLETATPAAIGDCMVKDANDLYVLGTTANRAGGIRCDGIALTPYSGTAQGAIALQQAGRVPNAVTGLGVGAISWVRTSALGRAERCTPVVGDDIIGRCAANGDLSLMPGVLDATLVNGATTTAPTGTGLAKVVGGVFAAAASLLVDADVSATAAIALSKIVNPTGTGLVKASGGVITATAATLVDADVSGTAAIAGTKVVPAFGAQNVTIGDGQYIQIGATNPAAAGDVRARDGFKIYVRNVGNTADLCAFEENGGTLYVGSTSGGMLPVTTVWLNPSTVVKIADSVPLQLGTTSPATAGDFRMRSAASIQFRNNPNTNNLQLCATDTGDNIGVWGTTAQYGDFIVNTPNAQKATFQDASIYRLFIKSSALGIAVPVKGDGASAAMPFRWGNVSISAVNGDQTLTAAQYECPLLVVAGTPNMPVGLVAPNTQGSFYIVDNTCGQTATIKKSGGTGVAVLTGKRAIVYHNGTDYVRLTPDT